MSQEMTTWHQLIILLYKADISWPFYDIKQREKVWSLQNYLWVTFSVTAACFDTRLILELLLKTSKNIINISFKTRKGKSGVYISHVHPPIWLHQGLYWDWGMKSFHHHRLIKVWTNSKKKNLTCIWSVLKKKSHIMYWSRLGMVF